MKLCVVILLAACYFCSSREEETLEKPLPNDLPIQLPESIEQLLQRLEEAAATGGVDGSSIEAYLQQQYSKEELAQLQQLATNVDAEMRQSIQRALENFGTMLQSLKREYKEQDESHKLIEDLIVGAEFLRQQQVNVHAQRPTQIQQKQASLTKDWRTWAEQLQQAFQEEDDAIVTQRLVGDFLRPFEEDLKHCTNRLRVRLQDYDLTLWQQLGEWNMLLQRQLADLRQCSEGANGGANCPLNKEVLSIISLQLDDIVEDSKWLYADETDCLSLIEKHFNLAKGDLAEEIKETVQAARREL